MRLNSRLRKLELLVAPPAPKCDCLPILDHCTLIDGSIYPPEVPCLRGKCPMTLLPGQSPLIKRIVYGGVRRLDDGRIEEVGHGVRLHHFRSWAPGHSEPQFTIIVWRDEKGRLRYYGPPRWYELDIPIYRITKGVGVPDDDQTIIAELRRTDETPPIDSPCFRSGFDDSDENVQ